MKNASLLKMKTLVASLAFIAMVACEKAPKTIETVAEFTGQQVTGVTVSEGGRLFANFPRWRGGVESSVVEVMADGSSVAFPNADWNRWSIGDSIAADAFVGVQSVVANGNFLYVLDTRNSLWQGVLDAPRIYVFNLSDNQLADVLVLSEGSYKPNSYINDLRVNAETQFIYMTDSNEPGLVVYNLATRESRRVLDGHFSTTAEADHLTIQGEVWGGHPVHSDGIAFNRTNNRLYYHSLTGYTLYSVPTELLETGSEAEIEAAVVKEATTPAPDGMIFDEAGNLYMADLENQKIVYLTPAGELKTLCEGEAVRWADTFSIYQGELYYTNSRINEVKGDIADMVFDIRKIKLD